MADKTKAKSSRVVRYNRWGYIFLIPFFTIFIIFQLIPLVDTIWNSFFENYRSGLKQIGPTFVGLENYAAILKNPDLWKYVSNTLIMWIIGFIPQIILSLLMAYWFTDPSLKLKGQRFFKTVMYLPNLIMASAFAMLFFTLFSDSGPINQMLMAMGILDEPFKFFSSTAATRCLVGFMNFIMWTGNTMILLMAGMMGIDPTLYEAAEVDGATSNQIFWKITLPLLKPILLYVVITSLIGGLQMYDVPQVLTNGSGDPARTTMTMIMWLNKHLYNRNYGMGGALSVLLFLLTGALSLIVFKVSGNADTVKRTTK